MMMMMMMMMIMTVNVDDEQAMASLCEYICFLFLYALMWMLFVLLPERRLCHRAEGCMEDRRISDMAD